MSHDASTAASQDLGPAVRFPPPILFVGGYALGVLVSRWWPLPAPWGDGVPIRLAGMLLFGVGVALALIGIVTFRRAKVSVYPNRPARLLVTQGIYRFTRNPMYLGMTTAYLGGVLVTGMTWALVLLPVVLLVLYLTVVRREERHLMERFPKAYANYCHQVRRWI